MPLAVLLAPLPVRRTGLGDTKPDPSEHGRVVVVVDVVVVDVVVVEVDVVVEVPVVVVGARVCAVGRRGLTRRRKVTALAAADGVVVTDICRVARPAVNGSGLTDTSPVAAIESTSRIDCGAPVSLHHERTSW